MDKIVFHVGAWSLWLVAALVPALLVRNPSYLMVLLGAVSLVYSTVRRLHLSKTTQGWLIFLKIGVSLIVLSTGLNLLFVHAGETVLLTLPQWTLQVGVGVPGSRSAAIQIGGQVTLESLVFGLNNALGLVTILFVVTTFNLAVDHYQLLRFAPRFLYQSGIVASIALTFVPQMMIAAREIREAQAIRGHRLRRPRDLLPLLVALLTESLERAIALAESMEARGFGGQLSRRNPIAETGLKLAIVLALLLLLGGVFFFSYWPNQLWSAIALALGIGLLAAVFWLVGRGVQRSRYRVTVWHSRDTGLSLTAGLSLGGLAAFWLIDRLAFFYYPYPRFVWPGFNLLFGLILLFAATPALLLPASHKPSTVDETGGG